MSEFILIDGEGVTHPDGAHDYVLLSAGNVSLHLDGARLSFHEIMPFLYRQQQLNPDAVFGGFYLTYDWSQWLKDIPADTAWMMLSDKGIALRRAKHANRRDPFPIRFAGWEFDIMGGGRRFKLRPATSNPYHIQNVHRWMYICDMGPFWQTSLVNAVDPAKWPEPLCSDDEWQVILEGKRNRATAVFDLKMVRYNVTENLVMARAMQQLEKGFAQQGWKLRKQQWFGPGQVAEAWLRSINAPTQEDIRKTTPDGVLRAALGAYYGGWFEIPRHGHVAGVSYEYDINSAYPHVIAGLPCLSHGRWQYSRSGGRGSVCLSRVTVNAASDGYLGGLPHRDGKGIISRPLLTRGWYWQAEIDAAVEAGLIDDYTVHESWSLSQECGCVPFVDIRRLYQQRQQVGKNTATGKALKLVYNSAYGKFAQSVGSPKYSNPIYAGLITSGCRTLILSAIANHPTRSASVLMVATDGIYFRSENPYLERHCGHALGDWSRSTKRNLTLFMPGVYWDDETRLSLSDDKVSIKSRGINGRDLARRIDEIDERFGDMGTDWPSITVPIRFSVVSPKLANSRGKWGTCGHVITDGTKTLSSNPVNKRDPTPFMDGGILTTAPYQDKGESQPYSKDFALDIEGLLDGDDLVTDDGLVNSELTGLLKDW